MAGPFAGAQRAQDEAELAAARAGYAAALAEAGKHSCRGSCGDPWIRVRVRVVWSTAKTAAQTDGGDCYGFALVEWVLDLQCKKPAPGPLRARGRGGKPSRQSRRFAKLGAGRWQAAKPRRRR